jgi:hypothetical protein
MLDSAEQQRIVQEVFAATGSTLPLDDPIVLAALFHSSVVRAAGADAAAAVARASQVHIEELTRAVEMNRAAAQDFVDAATTALSTRTDEAMRAVQSAVEHAQTATRGAARAADTVSTVAVSASRQAIAHQATFIEILDRRIPHSGNKPGSIQASPVSKAVRPRWQVAAVGAITGALFVTIVNFVACGYSFSWVHDASIGRQFLGALPYLDHELRARLVSDLEKLQPHK